MNIQGVVTRLAFKNLTNALPAITYSCISPLILGFATIGLFLLYIAFRYNIIYAKDTTLVNTQGRSFAKAINQLTTGVYLSELCLIGLFAIATASDAKAAASLGLMIAFTVITVIFHLILNRTIKSLEKNVSHDPNAAVDVELIDHAPKDSNGKTEAHLPPSSVTKKPVSFLVRLLHPPPLPWFDANLSTPVPAYTEEERDLAYLPPAITTKPPILWFARDEMGISQREVTETSKVIPCTDEGARFEGPKGKLLTGWVANDDKVGTDLAQIAPIYERPVIY